jgi:hypothetical protein
MNPSVAASFVAAGAALVAAGFSAFTASRSSHKQWRRDQVLPLVAKLTCAATSAQEVLHSMRDKRLLDGGKQDDAQLEIEAYLQELLNDVDYNEKQLWLLGNNTTVHAARALALVLNLYTYQLLQLEPGPLDEKFFKALSLQLNQSLTQYSEALVKAARADLGMSPIDLVRPDVFVPTTAEVRAEADASEPSDPTL